MKEARTLKVRNYVAYGLGDLYGGGSFFLISTFSMYFLVSIVGLNPILAGLIPGLGKIWDSISDPLMGYLSDTSNSKRGRRRVFFLIGIIPIALSFTLLWVPIGPSNQIAQFLYYFFAYLFFYSCSTMVLVPYSALSAEMTTNFSERNKLTGTRMIFSMGSTLLGGLVAQPLIQAFPTQTQGHLVMGAIFGVFFAIPYLFVYLGTWELPFTRAEKQEKPSVFKNFASLIKNRSFKVHMLMYICAYAAMDVLMAWFKFYVIDYLQKPGFVTIGLGTLLITQMLALPVYVRIGNKKGHAKAYRIGLAIWALAIFSMIFQRPQGSNLLLVINCFFIGLGMSAAGVIPFQLLPFVADVDELITGQKRAGTYAGAMTLVRKLIQGAFVLPLLGLLLTLIGYNPQAQGMQSTQTLLSLRLIFTIVPTLFAVTGFFVSFTFKITPKTHAIMQKEIQRLQEGGSKQAVDAETKTVCETLTGIEYEKLFN
ncbi:MAG: MFS transporter [Spirochaetia bacterium]|nr:MFS transporter [Spirochaetia bacterium]